MKEFNVKEFNRLCAEFMGFVKITEINDFCYCENSKEVLINQKEYKILETNFENRFAEDWNWIMQVVEKIESLNLGTVKIPITFSYEYQSGSQTEIQVFHNAKAFFRIEFSNCSVDISGNGTLRKGFITIDNIPTKKEATVQAIWLFLNWYK